MWVIGFRKARRPEGPTVSSHGRQAVDRRPNYSARPEGPALPPMTVGPSGLGNHSHNLIHALTGVAIRCRPFGPSKNRPGRVYACPANTI